MEKTTKEEFVKKAIDTLARNEVYDLPSKNEEQLDIIVSVRPKIR